MGTTPFNRFKSRIKLNALRLGARYFACFEEKGLPGRPGVVKYIGSADVIKSLVNNGAEGFRLFRRAYLQDHVSALSPESPAAMRLLDEFELVSTTVTLAEELVASANHGSRGKKRPGRYWRQVGKAIDDIKKIADKNNTPYIIFFMWKDTRYYSAASGSALTALTKSTWWGTHIVKCKTELVELNRDLLPHALRNQIRYLLNQRRNATRSPTTASTAARQQPRPQRPTPTPVLVEEQRLENGSVAWYQNTILLDPKFHGPVYLGNNQWAMPDCLLDNNQVFRVVQAPVKVHLYLYIVCIYSIILVLHL